MYRNIINELLKWKSSPGRKPLLLLGARQVGETYILKHMGNTYYKNVAYINCDNNPKLNEYEGSPLLHEWLSRTRQVDQCAFVRSL